MRISGEAFSTGTVVVAVALATALLAGCGGGGSTGAGPGPTSTTRARVAALAQSGARSLTLSGVQSPMVAVARNGLFSAGSLGEGAPTGALTSMAVPMVGAFIRNVAAVPPTTRALHLRVERSVGARHGRDVSGPLPPVTTPCPFYYDDYLGLWVQIQDTATSSTYQLYLDEAKMEPAGSIVTTWPADWSVYPQVTASTYDFTAGFLAGAHGSANDTSNADGSGSSSYQDTFADGSTDSGTSTWGADGSSSWSSRAGYTDGSWYECSGTFLPDGSGKTHEKSSDGYGADFIYNADGSGSGTITGPDPGLPARIVWDVYGNETITYADGTMEHIPAMTVYGVGSGSGSTGSTGSTGSGTVTPPSPPSTSPNPVPTVVPV